MKSDETCLYTSLIKEERSRRLLLVSINLLVVYRESVNLIGYITRRLSAVDYLL